MKNKWRKWNRVLHRDLSYFFTGMTVIYALSGIALNHIQDWNPSYIIQTRKIQLDKSYTREELNEPVILNLLEKHGEKKTYKKYFATHANRKSHQIVVSIVVFSGVARGWLS